MADINSPPKGRLLPLVRQFYAEDLKSASETLILRRSRWLGLKIQWIIASGECIAVGSMREMWDHGQRLIHLYVLWGHYKAVYQNSDDEYIKAGETRLRIKSLGIKTSARVVDKFLRTGEDQGLWTLESRTTNGDRKTNSTGRFVAVRPTAKMLADDACAGLFSYLNDYVMRSLLEQAGMREFWRDELGYSEESLLTLSAKTHQSRTRASV